MSEYPAYQKYAFLTINEIQKCMLHHDHDHKNKIFDKNISDSYNSKMDIKDETCVQLDTVDILNLQEYSSCEGTHENLKKTEDQK